MGGLEGYKGPNNTQETGGIQDIPLSFESQNNNNETQGKSVKNELDGLKQQIQKESTQLNIKIEETIDTFDEQLGKVLSNIEKQDFSNLLKDTSEKSPSSKIFIDKVLTYIKSYGTDIQKTDFNDIIGMVIAEQQKIIKKEELSDKKEELSDKKEELSDKKEELSDKKEELSDKKEELSDKEQNLINLKNSLIGLDKNNDFYGKYIVEINELFESDFDDEKVKVLLDKLKFDKNAFFHIANDLQKQDEINGTNKFEEFTSSLAKIDSEFLPIIDSYKDGTLPARQEIALGFTSIEGVNIDAQTLKLKTGDGFNVEVGKEGRKLFLDGSDYKLDSKLDIRNNIKEIDDIEKETKQEVSGFNETLNSIQSLKNYVEQSIINGTDIKDVKQNIKNANPELYNELQLDLVTSLEQVKLGLNYLYNKTEKEKDKILKAKKQKVDKIVFRNAISAKEKDKNKKETLKSIIRIGFDLIPQGISDDIIDTLNSNNTIKLLGFQSKIDIENGNLGTNFDNDINKISIKEIQKFTELMNIMISGSKDYPVVIDSLTAIGKPIFKNELGEQISDANLKIFINDKLGTSPESKIRLNIDEYLENRDDKAGKENGGENSKQK